jgi:hypothetical protein
MLAHASSKTRVVCLVDALNQFERTQVGRFATWLPDPWPQNAYLVATAITGEESASLGKRHGFSLMELLALNEQDSVDIIQSLCRYKKLQSDVISVLTSKRREDGIRACGNPLWLTITVNELLLMDEDDFGRLGNLAVENLIRVLSGQPCEHIVHI